MVVGGWWWWGAEGKHQEHCKWLNEAHLVHDKALAVYHQPDQLESALHVPIKNEKRWPLAVSRSDARYGCVPMH